MADIIADNLKAGEVLETTVRKTRVEGAPVQYLLGRDGMNQWKISGFDPVPYFKKMSPAATWLWWTLVAERNSATNVAVLRSKSLTPYQRKTQLTQAVKELKSYDMLRKIRQETYILNPKALLTDIGTFKSAWNQWEKY